MEKHLRYWQDSCSDKDSQSWLGNPFDSWKKELRLYIKNSNYNSLLDCGAGLFAQYFGFKEENIDIEYTATEITEKYLDVGRSQGIDVYNYPVQNMPFPNKSYDVVLCLGVINHQRDFKDVIMELTRVAKKEVIITFFKPFYEEEKAQLEIERHSSSIETIENVGVIIHRQPNMIYNLFFKNSMEDFMIEKKLDYNFITYKDTVALSIKK